MALRTGHGRGAGSPRVEVLPPDELPAGVPAPAGEPLPPPPAVERTASGRVVAGEGARELARRGGLAKAAKAKQLRSLEGLGIRGAAPEWLAPYLSDALEFVAHELARLAQTVGGGTCGASPASMVQTAALQQAASRAAFASGDLKLGSKLGNDARQNLLAAHELCAREAVARRETQRRGQHNPLEAAFGGEPGSGRSPSSGG